jgi:hypothetical protein
MNTTRLLAIGFITVALGCGQACQNCAPGSGMMGKSRLFKRFGGQQSFEQQVARDPFPTAQQQGVQEPTVETPPLGR